MKDMDIMKRSTFCLNAGSTNNHTHGCLTCLGNSFGLLRTRPRCSEPDDERVCGDPPGSDHVDGWLELLMPRPGEEEKC